MIIAIPCTDINVTKYVGRSTESFHNNLSQKFIADSQRHKIDARKQQSLNKEEKLFICGAFSKRYVRIRHQLNRFNKNCIKIFIYYTD